MTEPFWFKEREVPFHQIGERFEILVERVLHEEESPYQTIQVFDTPAYGILLALDGIVQTTERDEFIYHEMLALLPCLTHGNPQEVLIIGGGDGGALREVLRVGPVKRATMVEIDQRVIEVSRQFLPQLSAGAFDDPRTTLIIGDGLEVTRNFADTFDVIILDLTDPFPEGPSMPLFQAPFFRDVRRALRADGLFLMNSGLLAFQVEWIRTRIDELRQVFPHVVVHSAPVPSYGVGPYSFLMASARPLEAVSQDEMERRFRTIAGTPRYLSPEMYLAARTLPPYLHQMLYD
jgi:spermidine synthase